MMATDKDYTGRVRADFIKRMFPDVMKDIELDSIRNFKFQPDTGSIVIDEPDKGDYHFHFDNKKIPCKHFTCKGLLFELSTQTRGRTGTGCPTGV